MRSLKSSPERAAALALLVIVIALDAHLLFNFVAIENGWPTYLRSFSADSGSRFGDFFSMTLSFPGGPIHPVTSLFGMDQHVAALARAATKFDPKIINHFHMMPVSILMALGLREGFTLLDPVVLFVVVMGCMIVALGTVVTRHAAPGVRARICATALLSYPTLLALDRGHIFSLAVNAMLLAGVLRIEEEKRIDRISLLLLALAINLRPNLALIPIVFFLAGKHWRFRDGVHLAALSGTIFAVAMAVAHLLYPDYSPTSWWEGLRTYSNTFVYAMWGQSYGSSLFGALCLTPLGDNGVLYSIVVAEALLLLAVIAARRDRLTSTELLFVTAVIMVTGGQVFADYHLLIFLAPLILVVREWHGGRTQRVIFAASLFVLVPKNYFFVQTSLAWTSLQVAANPIALLAGASAVLWFAFRREAQERSVAAAPAGS